MNVDKPQLLRRVQIMNEKVPPLQEFALVHRVFQHVSHQLLNISLLRLLEVKYVSKGKVGTLDLHDTLEIAAEYELATPDESNKLDNSPPIYILLQRGLAYFLSGRSEVLLV